MADYIITANELPSKSAEIAFNHPYYGEYRKARKAYPSERSNERPAYSVEELLFAMMLESVDGHPVTTMSDVADRLEMFTIPDRQYLVMAFVEAIFATPLQTQEARDYAEKESFTLKDSYTVPESLMPSGSLSLSFRHPNSGTEFEVRRRYKGPEEQGCSLEQLMLAYCLDSINGAPIETTPRDIISVLDEMEIADVQVAQVVFANLFSLNTQQQEGAQSKGKSLRQQRLDSRGTQTKSQKNTIAASRKANVSTPSGETTP